MGLGFAGMVPGIGEIADGANALIYLGRGDLANAGLNAAAMVPFVGWAPGGAKLASHLTSAIQAYPRNVGRFEWHHIRPQYLGGLAGDRQVLLPAEYHQLITNEFRRLAPYGTAGHNVRDVMQQVYRTYPINSFPHFR